MPFNKHTHIDLVSHLEARLRSPPAVELTNDALIRPLTGRLIEMRRDATLVGFGACADGDRRPFNRDLGLLPAHAGAVRGRLGVPMYCTGADESKNFLNSSVRCTEYERHSY